MKQNKGFTLIEMLVTATIAAMVAAAGLVSYTTVNRNARNARRQSDLEQLKAAIELARTEDGDYQKIPGGANPTPDTPYTCSSDMDCWEDDAGGGFIPTLRNAGYLDSGREIADPRALSEFKYTIVRSGFTECPAVKTYEICADLEPKPGAGKYCVCNP